MPKIKSIISGFISPKTGAALGGVSGFIVGGRGFDGIYHSITQAIQGNIHFPTDMASVTVPLLHGLPMVFGGMIAKAVGKGIHPVIGKLGSFLTAFGGAYIAGGVAGHLLYESTHSQGAPGQPYTGTNAQHYQRLPVDPYTSHYGNPTGRYTMKTVVPYGTPHLGQRVPAYPGPR